MNYILNLKLNKFFNSNLYTLDLIIQSKEEVMPSEEENKILNNQQKILPGENNLNNIILILMMIQLCSKIVISGYFLEI